MLGEYEINKHSYEGFCYTKLPFSPFLEICWDVYFTLLNGFFHSVPQFLFFKIFLFLWVLLIAFDTFSRENVLSWIYMYIWYVSQIGLMTGKYSEIATYNWKKNVCAKIQIAPISCWNVHLCRQCYFPGLYRQESILLMEITGD